MDNLQKSLTELIDETLAEIEALKKSERYSAQEIELADEKANGSAEAKAVAKADDEDKEEEKEEEDEAKKADDEDEEDEEDEDEDEEDSEAEMKKAEEACAKALKKYEMRKAEAEHKRKMHLMKKGEWAKKADEDKEDKKDEEDKDLKKSIEARVAPIESKLSEVLSAIKKIAETPVPSKGASFRNVQPLTKSAEVEPLTKSYVLSELVSLKKSGKEVLSEDVIQVEDGSADHLAIARKYGIKA